MLPWHYCLINTLPDSCMKKNKNRNNKKVWALVDFEWIVYSRVRIWMVVAFCGRRGWLWLKHVMNVGYVYNWDPRK